jgi:phosphatidate cytidylyltransferase
MIFTNPTFDRVIGGILILLVVASLIGFILSRAIRSDSGRATVENLNARIRAWWAMVAVIAVALGLGPTATLVLFGIISFLALREFLTLAPTRAGDHRTLFLCFFLVIPLQYWLISDDWYGLVAIFIPVYVFIGVPAVSVLAGDTSDFLTRSAKVQWGLMLTVYALGYAPALLMLTDIPGYVLPPAMLLIFLIVVVQISDVMQYVFGKLFGRHKLAPLVSPSKTIEGLAGGGLSAIVLGAALHGITPFSAPQAAAMAAIIVLGGFLGGLVLSAVKRDLGVKDWGTIIEGHGGMLDRMDSVCFAAPLFFHATRYFFTP